MIAPTLAQRVLSSVYGMAKRKDMLVHRIHLGYWKSAPENECPKAMPKDFVAFNNELNGVHFDLAQMGTENRFALSLFRFSPNGNVVDLRSGTKQWGIIQPDKLPAALSPAPQHPWPSEPTEFKYFLRPGTTGPAAGSALVFFANDPDGSSLAVEVRRDGSFQYHRYAVDGALDLLAFQSFTDLIEEGLRTNFRTGWSYASAVPHPPLQDVGERKNWRLTIEDVRPLALEEWKSQLIRFRNQHNFDPLMSSLNLPERCGDPVASCIAAMDKAVKAASSDNERMHLADLFSFNATAEPHHLERLWNGGGSLLTVILKPLDTRVLPVSSPTVVKTIMAIPDLRNMWLSAAPGGLAIEPDAMHAETLLPIRAVLDSAVLPGNIQRSRTLLPFEWSAEPQPGTWEVSCMGDVTDHSSSKILGLVAPLQHERTMAGSTSSEPAPATLAQRVLEKAYAIVRRRDMDKVELRRGDANRGRHKPKWPAVMPADMQAFYEEVNGLYVRAEGKDYGVGFYLAMLRYVDPKHAAKMGPQQYAHFGHFMPRDVSRAGPPPPPVVLFDEKSDPRYRSNWNTFIWNAIDDDPRFEEGSQVVFFEGSEDEYCIVLEVTQDGRNLFYGMTSSGRLEDLKVTSFTELMERGIDRGFCFSWYEPDCDPPTLRIVAERTTCRVTIKKVEHMDGAVWKEHLVNADPRALRELMLAVGKRQFDNGSPLSLRVQEVEKALKKPRSEKLRSRLSQLVSDQQHHSIEEVERVWNGGGYAISLNLLATVGDVNAWGHDVPSRALLGVQEIFDLPFGAVPRNLGLHPDGIHVDDLFSFAPKTPRIYSLQREEDGSVNCEMLMVPELAAGLRTGQWEVSCCGHMEQIGMDPRR